MQSNRARTPNGTATFSVCVGIVRVSGLHRGTIEVVSSSLLALTLQNCVVRRLMYRFAGQPDTNKNTTYKIHVVGLCFEIRDNLPSSIAHWQWPSSSLCWHQNLSFPEQTLGSGTEVSQTLIHKYGTVCRLHLNSPAEVLLFKQHLKSYLFNAILDHGA